MPNTNSLTLNDGSADKTYNKVLATGDTVMFSDSSASTSAGQSVVAVTYSPRSARRATTKVSVRVSVPYEQTVDGEIVVKHTSLFSGTFTIPDSVPSSERERLIHLVKNQISDTSFIQVVSGPEAYF